MSQKTYYRRHLPHIQPPEGNFTITYRLAGSLPKSVIDKLKNEYERKKFNILEKLKGDKEAARKELNILKETYRRKMDHYLDQVLCGPTWLKDPTIAKIVMDSLHHVEKEFRYWTLWSYCLMPNHVHLECTLKTGAPSLCDVLKSHKNYTANRCNQLLGRSGQFWQHESFDRLIRDEHDFYYRIFYTIDNPKKAKLVKNWWDWPYTYIHPKVKEEISKRYKKNLTEQP